MKKCNLCGQTSKHTKWCNDTRRELNHLRKTGIPRCSYCHTEFVRVDEYSWKSDCECYKKPLGVSIG